MNTIFGIVKGKRKAIVRSISSIPRKPGRLRICLLADDDPDDFVKYFTRKKATVFYIRLSDGKTKITFKANMFFEGFQVQAYKPVEAVFICQRCGPQRISK